MLNTHLRILPQVPGKLLVIRGNKFRIQDQGNPERLNDNEERESQGKAVVRTHNRMYVRGWVFFLRGIPELCARVYWRSKVISDTCSCYVISGDF